MTHPVHGRIDGPIVIIGFGSIGRGVLPLIERHFAFDKTKLTVIDPVDTDRELLERHRVNFVHQPVTRDNYKHLLGPLLTAGPGQGFCVNLSVDTSSLDLMEYCREIGALYIDTVVEPWLGFYFDKSKGPEARSNYALRETVLAARRKNSRRDDGRFLLRRQSGNGLLAGEAGAAQSQGRSRRGRRRAARAARPGRPWPRRWASRGSTSRSATRSAPEIPSRAGRFVNTWSVEGFVSEGLQPAELGWGTHEKWIPAERPHARDRLPVRHLPDAARRKHARALMDANRAGAVRLSRNAQQVDLDRRLPHRARRPGAAVYRPTCHYAYHPCDDAVLSLHEMFGKEGERQPHWHILDENEIVDGIDELGVLLYGHAKNAYWFGSQLSVDETRMLAPYQNATGMQVTSAVLAGMVWALENPTAGIVEADDMDFRRCLEIQMPYLGPVIGAYTDWTPLKNRPGLFPEDIDTQDPWQFRNVLVR